LESGGDELGALAQTFNRMAERLAERTSQTQRLVELAQLLQVSSTTREIGDLFEHFVPKLVRVPGGQLYLRDAAERLLVPLAAWGPLAPESFDAASCWAVRLGKTYHSTGGEGPP